MKLGTQEDKWALKLCFFFPQGISIKPYDFELLYNGYSHGQVTMHLACRWYMCACSVIYNSLQPHGLEPALLLRPWKSLGKNTGVGCHALLQGIFWTQGLNSSSTSPALVGWFFYHWATWEAPCWRWSWFIHIVST